MRSCAYPVVILLTLSFLARALDTSTLDYPQRESKYSMTSQVDDFARRLRRPAVKIHRPSTANVTSTKSKNVGAKGVAKGSKANAKLVKSSTSVATKSNKLAFIDLTLKSKTELEARERRRKQKKKMNRAMIALLMAYKLKFAALIPTIIGGLILLLSTTALAGFFFALFAAVVGLKAH